MFFSRLMPVSSKNVRLLITSKKKLKFDDNSSIHDPNLILGEMKKSLFSDEVTLDVCESSPNNLIMDLPKVTEVVKFNFPSVMNIIFKIIITTKALLGNPGSISFLFQIIEIFLNQMCFLKALNI